jgi:purine-cytosine permease-like protein
LRAALSRQPLGWRGVAVLRPSLLNLCLWFGWFLAQTPPDDKTFLRFRMEIANPVGTPSTACIAVTTMR